jgi:RNA polymerase subunit RPABC4/transcription elongation factor Spt4
MEDEEYCTHCGEILDDPNDEFCMECGYPDFHEED